ncbi:hypothetical protein ciss_07590 [Carboxydothermus islandicus]|uniref:Uncharacterized protein n=1 Tax=Carboxydothermus islandicus TaxID=661089 RepID=A0A1L8D0W0_9THEO|nr:hypothetical protein [Carboxydothermus islandicus]GAV24826.1 hypothetical protein ciss_07590 [Carboxydothermus islandicus]
MKKGVIKAVHDDDLEQFLDSLGLLKKIRKGKMRCAKCNTTITLENFQCVYPEEGKIKVCCSKLECYRKVINWGEVIINE